MKMKARNPKLNFGNESEYISEESKISEKPFIIGLILPFEISSSPSFQALISLYLQNSGS